MSLSRIEKIDMYKALKDMRAEHLIDGRTYGMMLNGLGISENDKRVLMYEGDLTLNITLV